MKQTFKKRKIPYQAHGGGLSWAAVAHGYNGVLGRARFSMNRLRSWIFHFLCREIIPFPSWKVALQRARGVHIGKNVSFLEKIFIDEVYPEYVFIDDNVALAPFVRILAHQNPPEAFRSELDSFVAPVIIKRGAWIGFGATILPGVTIGEFSVIGANSLVNKNIPPRVFAAGTPAKIIRKLENLESGQDLA